ncbi:MAG: archease [Thermoguttaceae bacterium]|jgi:SHS2 domain-containing protein
MYETFEHTADVGLRIRAATLDDLFADAALGMFSIMVENLDEVRPSQPLAISLAEDQPDALLRLWLAELLYTFHVRRMVFSRFEVAVRSGGLTATAWGEPIDPARHQLDVEIKAVTWHGLKLDRQPDGWLAEVIVDI